MTDDCPVCVTLDVVEDTFIKISRSHSHENEFLPSLVSSKVAKGRKKALEGSYSKAKVVYGQLMASIQADPGTSMGVGKFTGASPGLYRRNTTSLSRKIGCPLPGSSSR